MVRIACFHFAVVNTRNTIKRLWQAGYIPIVNENDTVSIEEILLGDNDKLSALVAVITGADLLLLVSDIDGIFDRNPDVLALSRLYAPIGVVNFIGFASRSPAMAFINGIGFSRLAFVTGFLDGIVARIGLSLLFGVALGMGISGFWLGSALAGYTFFVVGIVYYAMGTWRRRKTLVHE